MKISNQFGAIWNGVNKMNENICAIVCGLSIPTFFAFLIYFLARRS